MGDHVRGLGAARGRLRPEGANVAYAHPRPRSGETADQTKARGGRDFFALLETPFYDVRADAAITEIISALHERQVLA